MSAADAMRTDLTTLMARLNDARRSAYPVIAERALLPLKQARLIGPRLDRPTEPASLRRFCAIVARVNGNPENGLLQLCDTIDHARCRRINIRDVIFLSAVYLLGEEEVHGDSGAIFRSCRGCL